MSADDDKQVCEGCGKPLPVGMTYHDKLCRALAKRKRWRERNKEQNEYQGEQHADR